MDKLEKLQRRMANQMERFWANIRTTRRLFERSRFTSISDRDTLSQQIAAILDQGNLIYPPILEELGLSLDTPLLEKKEALGLPVGYLPCVRVRRFQEFLADKVVAKRKNDWIWRVNEEFRELDNAGWYPFFVTLTVDPMAVDPKELWQEGRAFRRYIRKLSRVSAKACGHLAPHKKPYRPESDYCRYIGVIEHGKSREHHHGHFLIWMRAIPDKWKRDPNAGRKPEICTLNECRPMRRYWKWSLPGLSPAMYFRTVGDIWQRKCHFILPIGKDGKPMNVGGPQVAGLYIIKYLSKEFREWKHRTKATRNLGLTRLRETIRQLTDEQIEALTWRPSTFGLNLTLSMIQSVPIGLMRSIAQRENFYRKYRSNRHSDKTLLQSNTETFIALQSSVRAGVRPDRMPSAVFYDWLGQYLPVPNGYSDQRLLDVYTLLAGQFPPIRNHKTKKLGGTNYGFT